MTAVTAIRETLTVPGQYDGHHDQVRTARVFTRATLRDRHPCAAVAVTGVRLTDAATCPPPERRAPPALTVTSIYDNGRIARPYLALGLLEADENRTPGRNRAVITTPAVHHQPRQGRHHRTPGTSAVGSGRS